MSAAVQIVARTGATGPARPELDEITLRRAQRGDEAACRALVDRYQAAVFALISRMLVGAGGEVEDVAQETFLEVFRSLERFAPLGPARLSTWILTIASRRAIDALRRRPEAPPAPAEAADHIAGTDRADDRLREDAVAAALAAAVAALSPEHRAALLLREYHEFEYAEIARALAIDIGTVKSRLSRARAAVRRAVAEVRDD